MQYFLGIAVPSEYSEKVIAFRQRWDHHQVAEPHITVKAQSGLSPHLEWLGQVEEVCAQLEPFEVRLGGPEFFHDSVLFLSLKGEEACRLHRRLLEAVNPPQELRDRYFEGEMFHAHMTLAHGLPLAALQDMARAAEELLAPYPAYRADFLRVYRQDEPDGAYVRDRDIPFGVR